VKDLQQNELCAKSYVKIQVYSHASLMRRRTNWVLVGLGTSQGNSADMDESRELLIDSFENGTSTYQFLSLSGISPGT
jgi:hypothetical protein